MSVYNNPLYYEIAFNFFDVAGQVDLIERFAKRYSRRKVRRILDVCCGPSLQLREFVKRGYDGVGLDRSREMLRYLMTRDHRIETVCGDMRRFHLKRKADLAMIMMGSLGELGSVGDYVANLNSVAASMNPGGLYLIENFRFFVPVTGLISQAWSMRRGGIRIRTKWSTVLRDPIGQVFQDALTLNVNDCGKMVVLEDIGLSRCFSAAQFVDLVEGTRKFDLVGWFERDRVQRLQEDSGYNVLLLRRR